MNKFFLIKIDQRWNLWDDEKLLQRNGQSLLQLTPLFICQARSNKMRDERLCVTQNDPQSPSLTQNGKDGFFDKNVSFNLAQSFERQD